MKHIFLVLFISAYILSCKKDGTNASTVGLKKCTSVIVNAIPITYCLDSVLSDSRCPSGAVCVWAGTAIASFSLKTKNTVYHFTLSTLSLPNLYPSDTRIAEYKIRFKNLLPYPNFSAPPPSPNDYKAELEIQ